MKTTRRLLITTRRRAARCGHGRTALRFCALCALLLLAGCQRPARPDIILIGLDTTRADHLSCYNPHSPAATPALDALAARGLRFSAAFTPIPSTLSAFTAVMTGRYPHNHGVPKNGWRVPDEATFLPERLAPLGYQSAAFIASYALHADHNFNQGFNTFDAAFDLPVGNRLVQRDAATVTDAAIAWLKARLAGRRRPPLLLFAHYYDPHLPYRSHPDNRPTWSLPAVARLRQDILANHPHAATSAAAANAAYAAEIAYMDRHVGRLLDFITATPALANTIIIAFADHGENLADRPSELYDHGRRLYDSTIHVPLIIAGPPVTRGTSASLASLIDITPTVLALLGQPLPAEIDGEPLPLAPHAETGRQFICSGASKPWSDSLENSQPWPNARKERAIRTATHKLIANAAEAGWELYHLASDPGEIHDLHPGAPATLLDPLRQELDAWQPRDPTSRHGSHTTNHEALQKLRSLGYSK